MLQAANQQTTLSPTQKLAADVDKDGVVTIFDVAKLLQFVNAKIPTLE